MSKLSIPRLSIDEATYPWDTVRKGRTGKAYFVCVPNGDEGFATTLGSAQELAAEIRKKLTSSIRNAPGRPPLVKIYEIAITRMYPTLA